MLLLVFLWWRSVEKKTNTKICYLLYKKYVLSPKGNTFSFFFTWQSKLQTFYIICFLWQLNIAFGDLNFEVSLAQLKTIAEVTISLTRQKKRKFHFTSSIVCPNCINNVMLNMSTHVQCNTHWEILLPCKRYTLYVYVQTEC